MCAPQLSPCAKPGISALLPVILVAHSIRGALPVCPVRVSCASSISRGENNRVKEVRGLEELEELEARKRSAWGHPCPQTPQWALNIEAYSGGFSGSYPSDVAHSMRQPPESLQLVISLNSSSQESCHRDERIWRFYARKIVPQASTDGRASLYSRSGHWMCLRDVRGSTTEGGNFWDSCGKRTSLAD